MSETPSGWTPTTLGELGDYFNGRGFKKSEWRDSGRPIIRIQNLTGSSTSYNYFQGEADERNVARRGDLLVSWAATLGAYIWSGPEGVVNQHIFKVESKIDRKFHKYLLDHKLAALMQHTHGSGMVHITRSKFDAVPVAVPGLSDQRRIVAILEDHLSRLEAADASMQRTIQRGEYLTTAVLEEEWARTAGRVSLGQLGKVLTGGTPGQVEGVGSVRCQFLTPGDVATGGLIAGAARTIAVKSGTAVRRTGGSAALVVCIGATLGKCGWTRDDVAFNQQINAVITHHPTLDAELVAALLATPSGQEALRSEASATTMPILNKSKFMRVQLPDMDLSTAARARQRLCMIRESTPRMLQTAHSQRRRAEALRRALLAAAFTGRLTGGSTDQEVIEELADV